MATIFLIEDNAPLRENTKALLELNGYNVSIHSVINNCA